MGNPFLCHLLNKSYILLSSPKNLRGLEDKVAGSHPGGPGSIPGVAFNLFENVSKISKL